MNDIDISFSDLTRALTKSKDAIAFVKALDAAQGDWTFTLAMAEYFAAEKERGRAEWEADAARAAK